MNLEEIDTEISIEDLEDVVGKRKTKGAGGWRAQHGEGPIDDEWSSKPSGQKGISSRKVLPFSLVVVIVKTCKETNHSSNSTGECNAPRYLPRHHAENKTWHHN